MSDLPDDGEQSIGFDALDEHFNLSKLKQTSISLAPYTKAEFVKHQAELMHASLHLTGVREEHGFNKTMAMLHGVFKYFDQKGIPTFDEHKGFTYPTETTNTKADVQTPTKISTIQPGIKESGEKLNTPGNNQSRVTVHAVTPSKREREAFGIMAAGSAKKNKPSGR